MPNRLPGTRGGRRRGATVLLAWLAVVAVPSAARAQAAAAPAPAASDAAGDAKSHAKAKLVEGGELLKQGEYKDALRRFQEAYELVPSPKIFYNFGLAYMNLGRTTEAVEAFERFLEEATDATPDVRANAERRRSELLPKVATIVVHSETEGAAISIDGRPFGTTPRKLPIRLDPGPHSLVLEKAPAPAFIRNLDVKAGERVVVEAKLADLPVIVASPPPPLAVTAPVAPVEPDEPSKWSRLDGKLKAAIGLGAAGVLALGFGGYEQLAASSKYKEFNDTSNAQNWTGKCDADPRVVPKFGGGVCPGLLSDGDGASLRAKIGFVAGGVLAASSVVLVVLSRRGHQEGASTAKASCVPSGAGVACAATF